MSSTKLVAGAKTALGALLVWELLAMRCGPLITPFYSFTLLLPGRVPTLINSSGTTFLAHFLDKIEDEFCVPNLNKIWYKLGLIEELAIT